MIIIPDIHGRKFWKKAVKKHEDEEIVFLGDYCDPYPYEGIHEDLKNFDEIIEFKKKHPKNVTLLIGNHDQQYFIPDSGYCSRHSYFNERSYWKRFNENRKLFQLCLEKNINGKRYLFSHAGITRGWKDEHFGGHVGIMPTEISRAAVPDELICDFLNNMYLTEAPELGVYLSDISFERNGHELYGSMTWADVAEHFTEKGKKPVADYQIFGHSQLIKHPIITEKFADLDVRRAFILNDKGEILEMDGTPAVFLNEIIDDFDFD